MSNNKTYRLVCSLPSLSPDIRFMAAKAGAAPATYSPSPTTYKKKRPPIFTDVDWVRPDGRDFHQCRPAFMRTGAVNAASGSAYAEFGNTKVIVSISRLTYTKAKGLVRFLKPSTEFINSAIGFGPRESKKAMMYSDVGRLNCNVSYTTFATPVRGQASDNKDISSQLHKSLEGAIMLDTFPKTTVDVFALVLESGGCDLPVVISCASLALADAGIMMYDLVAAVSVSCLGKNLVIDPVSEEENYQDGSLMITCLPSRNEVTQLTITGEWSTPKIHEAMELCLDACSKLGKIMRSCLKESTSTSQE
ncbi:hypothetical protein L1987_34668 [Smallanthus sonchifolius]|uniref:Uncharacterized protein n=1 Tax=Smallanthus sonchifolius TaxID=185202 RepID=A0ACB9HTX1_9ASTR|nr:hypothetical protein L1987_34668 [Smallanthus sonchifolius]